MPQALQLLESKLSDMVNRSVVLAKYLMSEDFVSKEKLVKDLGMGLCDNVVYGWSLELHIDLILPSLSGWPFNDVELLLPLSSIHTPAVGEKYGIGFV